MQGEKRKLPVGSIVAQAYRATFQNWRYAVRISWAWFVPLVILILAYDLLIETATRGTPSALKVAQIMAIWIATLGLIAPPISSIAVAWHRKLLRQESYPTIIYLQLDRNVWRYCAYLIFCGLVVIVAVLTQYASTYGAAFYLAKYDTIYGLPYFLKPYVLREIIIVISLLGILLAYLLFLRLSMLLPRLALGFRDASLREVWHRTKGSTWRLLLAAMLCVLPLSLGEEVLAWLLVGAGVESESSIGHVLARTVHVTANLLLGFIGLSLLTFCYRFFYEPQEAEQPSQDAAL